MTGPAFAHPATTRLSVIGLRGNALEHVADQRPRLWVTARHDGGAVPGTFLATRNAHAEKSNAVLAQGLPAPLAVLEIGVAAIDDDVTLLEMRQQAVDNQVDDLAGGGHQKDHAWAGQGIGQIRQVETGVQRGIGRYRGDECLGDRGRAVVHRHPESMVEHVEGDIASHDAETVDGDVGGHSFCSVA